MVFHVASIRLEWKIVPCSVTSPHHNGNTIPGTDQQGWDPSNPSIVSQTQEANGDFPYLSSDNEEGCINVQADNSEFGPVIAQINSVFDDKDDFLSAEIDAITDHWYLGGTLEFNLEYTNGGMLWQFITVVKDEDPHIITNDMIGNDLGPVSNGIHER